MHYGVASSDQLAKLALEHSQNGSVFDSGNEVFPEGKATSQLVPAKSDLEGGDLLDQLGMWFHRSLRILICRQCRVGLTFGTASGHLKNKHGHKVGKDMETQFQNFCRSRNVLVKPQDFAVPKAGGPPIQGLTPPEAGFSCRAGACTYSVKDCQTMLKHSRKKHGGGLAHNSLYQPSLVQCAFQGHGKAYFEVDPTASEESDLDMRNYLRATFLPAQTRDLLVLQDSDRDRSPLLKITMWDKFEVAIQQDAAQVAAAMQIRGQHTEEEHGGVFVSLARTVKLYHETTKRLLESSGHSFLIEKVLLNGPGYTAEQ